MLDVLVIFLVYVLSVVLISEFVRPRTDGKGVNFTLLLYHYHVLIGFYYGWFAKGTDTSFYWNLGDRYRRYIFETWFDSYGVNNFFIFFVNYPFSRVLGLEFWTGTFLYASVSSWAFILLYLVGEDLFRSKNIRLFNFSIWPSILLLPSLHFWSSGVGKDSLIFLFISMFFYCIRDFRKNTMMIIIAVIGLYHVRPHMAFIILLSTAFMLVIDGKLHFSYKIVFSLLSIFGFFIIYEEVLVFLKIEEFNNENIDELFNTTATNLSYGRSYVDMSDYPYPLKLFTFWFRPLFFDAHNISSFINSIENAICLVLSIVIFTKVSPLKGYKQAPNAVKIMLLTFLLASIAFAGALSNFGIIVRMKNMTFVYFLFFLVFCYDRHVYAIRLHKYKRYLARRQRTLSKTTNLET